MAKDIGSSVKITQYPTNLGKYYISVQMSNYAKVTLPNLYLNLRITTRDEKGRDIPVPKAKVVLEGGQAKASGITSEDGRVNLVISPTIPTNISEMYLHAIASAKGFPLIKDDHAVLIVRSPNVSDPHQMTINHQRYR